MARGKLNYLKGKKRIATNSVGRIITVKGYILSSNGRPFDGDGYVFKTALSQLRKEGHVIKYSRATASYRLIV